MTTEQTDRLNGVLGNTAIKTPVAVATTANIALTGEQTIDGVTTNASRVLVKNQTSSIDNGIYISDTGAWSRSTDFDGPRDVVEGTLIKVNGGSTTVGFWYVSTTGSPVPGTDAIDFGQSSTVLAVVTAYAQGILAAVNAAAARTVLGLGSIATQAASAFLAVAGGTMTGDITMQGASIVEAEGAAVTAAASTNIWATDGNTVHVTGNTGITDFATAPQAGAWMKVIFDGTPLLTQSANLNLNAGGSNITIEAGDVAFVYADTTTQMDVFVIRKSGAALGLIGLSQLSNTLAADVALNNTGNYFTGPTVAQGTTGTWFASGTVTLEDTAGGSEFRVKLWDGTTVISSAVLSIPNVNDPVPVHLSGYLASPAGNIRISVKDISSTSGQIRFNSSGESKDSTLCAFRVA